MLVDFIVVTFASFALWQLFMHAAWFEISDRLMPTVIFFTSLLLALPFGYSWLLALASTGGVGLLNVIMKPERLAPLDFSKIKKESQQEQSRKIYVPDLDG